MPTLIYSDFPRTERAMMLTLFPNQIVFLKFLNYIRSQIHFFVLRFSFYLKLVC